MNFISYNWNGSNDASQISTKIQIPRQSQFVNDLKIYNSSINMASLIEKSMLFPTSVFLTIYIHRFIERM